ncbi:3'-5' exonuclease [Inhella sp. 4Y17]|uniref:3'-5' exonuclease n=1 Tax=Inhella gelatinilytica TaxID=2795030 RepID=A0A931IVV6_9BURK|nr:3'-5' exonuclease [Inhella gelatinilytica]
MDTQLLAVVDFETTGVSPQKGARATEVAVVWVRGGEVVDRYDSLMYTGVVIPPFIEQLTGISNRLLETATPAATVMRELAERHPPCPMIAHNVGFDALFWREEMLKADCEAHANPERLCTVKLARKLYPQAPNCKLGTLAAFHELPSQGRAHRALADALTTAHLWMQMRLDIAHHLAGDLEGLPVTFELAQRLQALAFAQWPKAAGAYVKAFAKGPRLC